MKKTIISILITLLLSSCATSGVMTFTTPEGPRLFIRPVEMKGEYDVSIDINIPCTDFNVSGDSIVNYSVFFPAGSVKEIRTAVLEFSVSDDLMTVENVEMLFIESAGKKSREARFTSTLDEESMMNIVNNSDSLSASLIIGTNRIPLSTSKLKAALNELSLNLL